MAVAKHTFDLKTSGCGEVIDITPKVREFIQSSSLDHGIGCVILPGSTGVITTIEYEPGVIQDLLEAMEKTAPRGVPYAHDKAWGDGNGFSHVRSALYGASFSFPFAQGAPVLGTWQQIVFVDCDNRPRTRRIVVHLVGE
jgi:secondary thiamine-phosphate synthase enzyme